MEGVGSVRRRLVAFPAEVLQHLGLLIAFVLLVAAREFAAAHPALAAILIFVFSCPYLVASLATRRAHFLYGTMLLGAVSYFLACYALGAPSAFFPVLSVPLVVALWLVGQRLRKRLPAGLASFPRTVFRAMHITVAVFAAWALVQAPWLMASSGLGRYVAAATFLGYAALYLAHALAGAPTRHSYVFSCFLILGSALLGAAAWSATFSWLPALAAGALILFVGTRRHAEMSCRWSRHFYYCGATALGVSLALATLRWTFLLFDLALASLVLWLAYGWLAAAVGDVRRATTAERALAKWLFYGAMALCLPLAPMVLALPASPHVAAAALACGLLFAWIAWARRAEGSGERNLYVLPAVLLLSAGLLGGGRALPGWGATGWSLALPWALLAGAGLVYARLAQATARGAQRSLAEALLFTVFLAWFVPLRAGAAWVGLVGAHAGMVAALALARRTGERRFLYALGPAVAGALIAAAVMLLDHAAAAWVACAAAGAAAGALFIWSDAAERAVTRIAANAAWLVLSVAAVALAAVRGAGNALCSVTAVGLVAVLTAGWCRRRSRRDAQASLVAAFAGLATAAAIGLGPFTGWSPANAGACLLLLAAAFAASWVLSQGTGFARAAAGLFALGALLVIFGLLPGADARVAAGAGVVAALFVLAALARGRLPDVSRSCAVVGHLAGIVLACTALIQGWSEVGHPELATGRAMAWAIVPLVALYAAMPRLRGSAGFRVGALSWLTLLALFALAAWANTPYRHQAPVLAALALVWLGIGYGVRRSRAQAWSMPLLTCAALLAAFCGAVSVFSPAVAGSWRVFLVNGIVFAALFLILRQDLFAFLLTLSLSLMAYDWVKASTSRFTQDVLFYLVIGTGVLGVFFLLPYLKRLVDRLGALPMISIFTWRGAALTSVPVACGAFVILSAYSVKITEHPKFCISCHYMGEYYESWQHSSHQNVACVQCHYEPGVEAEFKGKMAGLVQLVKYVSHAYDNKPHALISNRSCMRAGCHADMGQDKQTVLFRGKVKFRHSRHLSEHPRGKELNCVSCHGQVVEGQHISVTETTCLTCHFYGRGSRPVAAGTCTTCHGVPAKRVAFNGQPFDHKDFLKGKKGVQCIHCHSQVTQGDGVVSATRCQSCHLHNTPKVGDQAQFHLVHVSKGHFDCLQCHDEIKHGRGVRSHELMASASCSTCHGDGRHSLQEKVYAGTAVPDLKAQPDVMFNAGVACDGCHLEQKTVRVGDANYTSRLSSPKQCADCHNDKDYAALLTEWQADTRKRLAVLQPGLADLEKACQSSQAPKEKVAEAQRLLAAAKTRVDCVVRDASLGAHNNVYVSSLLDRAAAELKECRGLLDGALKPRAEAP